MAPPLSLSPPLRLHPFLSPRATHLPPLRASSDDNTTTDPTPPDDDPFESRISRIRRKYRSGMGKKAEIRKAKKGGISKSGAGSSMYLPAVPLKEAESGGVKVEFGFSPYSEKVNGRIAILGLTALVLVELATGKGVLNYHTPGVVLIQVYFVAAIAALYVKYEKEKVSVWPKE